MDHTATRQAHRLTDAFQLFNRVSEQLSSSSRLLEHHLAEITRRTAVADREPAPEATDPASIRHLQPILDALPAGVVVLDGDGRVVHANRAALGLLGAPLAGVCWIEIIQRAFATRGRFGDLHLTDGRLVSLATNPLGGEPGQVILINEVTEARAMQDLLQRQQRLASMGEMAAALAHQIRTPLAASLLYVSQLEHHAAASPPQRRGIERIRRSLDHLDKLVRDMLMFAHGGSFSGEGFGVAELVDTFRRLSAPLVQDGGCRLEIIDDSGDAQLRGNPDALVAVLQNVLENAIQACRGTGTTAGPTVHPGQISLLVRRISDPESVEFLLKDDGPGIAPHVRDRVLEPFFTTKSQGTGLGLAVAKAVVQAHGGVLWIDSEPGNGTTAGIRLPMAGPGPAAAPSAR